MLAAVLLAAILVLGCALAYQTRRARIAITFLEERIQVATRSLESLQQAFARFAPADVVEDIIAQGISTRSETKEVTVLFADLQGFTAMSEGLDPTVLVRILNGYFQRMSRAITDQRGHVSKFIGDGILALFGALEPNPWQTNDAVHAALEMRSALKEYNALLQAEFLPNLAFGIGIHRGPVVAGVIGSDQLMEYTVIGDTVNLASRVESLTRSHEVDILVTEAVRQVLAPRFRLKAMEPMLVKGVSEPVSTFAVDGFDAAECSPADT